jgi:hypothetical protein
VTFASIEPDFTITPRPPSKPGVYLFLDEARRVMYVGLASDLQGVLYRYQHLEGRQAMRDRIAAEQATWASWTECTHPATPPSLEVLAIRRYQPPWNTQHNPKPRRTEDAVVFDAEEQWWLSLVSGDLDRTLERATSADPATPRGGEEDEVPVVSRPVSTESDRQPRLRREDTCCDAVLLAMKNLERRTGRTEFQLYEIVREVRSVTQMYPEVTIRTQVSSVMCANAPVHHADHTDDLIRVSCGTYRRASISTLS